MTMPAVSKYPLGEKPASVPALELGTRASFADLNYAAATMTKPTLSGGMIEAVLVKHLGATALVPATWAKWSVPFKSTSALAGASDAPAGLVDPFLTANVAQNEYFWLIISGPSKILSSGTLAANAVVISQAAGQAAAGSEDVHYGRMLEAADAGQTKRIYVTCRK